MKNSLRVYYVNVPNMGDKLNVRIIEQLFGYKVRRHTFLTGEISGISSGLGQFTLRDNPFLAVAERIAGFLFPTVTVWGTGFVCYKEKDNPYVTYNDVKPLDSIGNVIYWDEWEEDKDFEDEKEIKENCEIKINDIIIPFSFFYKFNKAGINIIQYSFKQNLKKIDFLFYGCKSLINIDLSNFNSQNITNMASLFRDCNSLTHINLSNFNTNNATEMSCLFYGCSSLINIDLSSFDTRNALYLNSMFYGCGSLINMNISHFNIQNVMDMSLMFCDCNSIIDINLFNFNNQNEDIEMGGMFSR